MSPLVRNFGTIIATWFYTGYLPKMPGTWGSLAAIPFAWYLWQLPAFWAWTLLALFTGIAILAADIFDRATAKHDNQSIVVDEVAGIFLTAAFATHTWQQYLAVFVLFRAFDIWKPWPVRLLDRHVRGGFGVVVDDLGAAAYAMLILLAFNRWA